MDLVKLCRKLFINPTSVILGIASSIVDVSVDRIILLNCLVTFSATRGNSWGIGRREYRRIDETLVIKKQ